ncbi:MAG: hypothetical protein ABI811_07970 [Acidobacteriota bacterium]
MTPLEQWLSDATRGLSAESAAQVRTEIQEHCESACEAGGDAIAALGDPRAANRGYRSALLTEQEALMAPVLTRDTRPSVRNRLLGSVLFALFVWRLMPKQTAPGFWPIMIAIFCTLPLSWSYPLTTIERSRRYLYIHGARSMVVVSVAGWYQGWISALSLGAVCFSLDYLFSYRRLSIFRKLAGGQTYSLLPEEPALTHVEAMYLNTLRNGSPYQNMSIAFIFLMETGMAVWLPTSFAPLAAWMIASFLAPKILPLYTEQRSRWFRIFKWTTMAVAAVLPALYGARVPWSGAVIMALFFVLFDQNNISLRRKLPVEQWPKQLYL